MLIFIFAPYKFNMALHYFNQAWDIDYEILSRYHFTAEMLLDSYIKSGRNAIERHAFNLTVEAESEQEARENLVGYAKNLDEKGIIGHAPHIIYLTQKLIEFEGNPKKELKEYKYILGELNLLSSLVALREDKKTKLTLEHSNFGKGHEHYVVLEDNGQDLIPLAIDAIINGVLKRIRSNKNQLPNNSALMDEGFDTITLEKVLELKNKCIEVSEKTFNSLLLYTVSKTLQKYLNNETTLSKEGATLTNDQARVIYATGVFFGLITNEREMDYDRVNYMKSVFKNKDEDQSIKITIL